MNKGTVKFFQTRKGWGFITKEDGTDIFVHWTGVKCDSDENSDKKKTLQPGQIVEFDVTDGKVGKYKMAINVTVVANDETIEE